MAHMTHPIEELTAVAAEKTAAAQPTALPISSFQLLVLAVLATVSMLFAGFASAYLVRRAGADWQPVSLPGILWLNTVLLFASSVTVERARRAHRRARFADLRRWMAVSALLGLAFLAGQLFAWRQLVAQGLYLPTNPYGSFFYVLTALHGAHLLGGILGLVYILGRVVRVGGEAVRADVLDGGVTYWHFMDGLWVFLFLLLLSY